MLDHADARPTKRFFILMLTSDIALEDAILDLIDNSIDSLIHSRDIDLSEKLLLGTVKLSSPGRIDVHFNSREVVVSDNCGGIARDDAEKSVFRLGRLDAAVGTSIGVYGIGMKRAIFKVGNAFEVLSRSNGGAFTASLPDIEEWSKDDDDWTIPLSDGAEGLRGHGTVVRITQLHDNVRKRVAAGTFEKNLSDAVARTYPLLLGKYVNVSINGERVPAASIPIAGSKEIRPAVEKAKEDGVSVTVIAGIAPRGVTGWSAERAGWYVICNGRVVVSGDKSDLTGWGTGQLPQFHSGKFRSFSGIALFFSSNPEKLPWTTTKRGLNRDSEIYQTAYPLMRTAARQVIAFLNRWYPGEETEEPAAREVAELVKEVDVRQVALSSRRPFKANIDEKKTTTPKLRVQFDITIQDLEIARRCLGKPGWSGVKIGRYAFDYFLKHECGK